MVLTKHCPLFYLSCSSSFLLYANVKGCGNINTFTTGKLLSLHLCIIFYSVCLSLHNVAWSKKGCLLLIFLFYFLFYSSLREGQWGLIQGSVHNSSWKKHEGGFPFSWENWLISYHDSLGLMYVVVVRHVIFVRGFSWTISWNRT